MNLLVPLMHGIMLGALILLTCLCAYLWFFAGFFFFGKRRIATITGDRFLTRFVFVVPAHNEAEGIAATIHSLKSVEYPPDLFCVVVIADNCSDRTAEIARQEGAQCLERFHASLRGKGYALRFAFEALLPQAYDAFVVIDADAIVSSNFLAVLDGRIRQEQKVVQAYDGLSNPDASILTYLFQVGNIIENRLFWEPKERLGAPVLLRGTGMCFSREILNTYPWKSFSIVEDTEYGLMLLENKVRVHFAPEIGVYARQPENLQQAFVQRVRWASGNAALTKRKALKFIITGISRGNFALADIGLSLIAGSKPLLLLVSTALLVLSVVIGSERLVIWSLILLSSLFLYLALGVIMNGISCQKMLRLVLSPFYLVWLCAVSVLGFAGFRKNQWLRTTR